MPSLSLQLEHIHEGLSVRRFQVREAISSLFEVDLTVVSPHDDLDFERIVGSKALFEIEAAIAHEHPQSRRWAGICSFLEQTRVEPGGLSTYRMRLVPDLWALTQRRDHRVFQDRRDPEIAAEILREWGQKPVLRCDLAACPKRAYRVQYGETDFDFLCRVLQSAGISFFPGPEEGAVELIDSLRHAPRRYGAGLHHTDEPGHSAHREHVAALTIGCEARPHKVALRGFDDRRSPKLAPEAESAIRDPAPRNESFHYLPGAFLSEGDGGGDTPVADAKGAVRAREVVGKHAAERLLAFERGARRVVSFRTNVIDLAPGLAFTIEGHPRADLSSGRVLVVLESTMEGSPTEEWHVHVRALFAEDPFVPPVRAHAPRVLGVQSAVVVGPAGEAVHTDELGRVRIQFPWDRRGRHDDHSSCWIRVAQGWAGGGFGLSTIPRVGQEVIVGFFEGDPDQPLVIAGVHGGVARPPQKLPERRTVSTWRTSSLSPHGGYNELLFDDAAGAELVHVHAERDLTKIVKMDETEATGRHRVIQVGERLTLTTGRASIVLDGEDITIAAQGNIHVRSGAEVDLRGVRGVSLNERDEPSESEEASADPDTICPAPGIHVRGPREFREQVVIALNRLQQTRAGARLVGRMGSSGETATIVPSSSKNGSCRPLDLIKANRRSLEEPGEGCGSTIGFNPHTRPGGAPPEAVLAFHMGQANVNALGMRQPPPTEDAPKPRAHPGAEKAFKRAMAAENEVREELGLPLRRRY